MKKDIAFGGVTRIPGGALSSDGDLMTAVDVCNDGMGLEMLEKPELLFGLEDGEELLCVHDPEGDEKHYITQMVVAGGDAPAEEDGDSSGGASVEPDTPEETVPVSDDPAEIIDPYIEPVVPSGDPAGQDEESASADVVPYQPPSGDELVVIETVIAGEATRHIDNGGTVVNPPGGGGGTVDPPEESGVFLIFRDKDGNMKQHIDITAYGKVTAVQPMGNTLVCNHAGTAENAAAVRYYLFKLDKGLYSPLGSAPPMVDIRFGLQSTWEYYPKTKSTFDGSEYKTYGGVSIDRWFYTDTVPVWWARKASEAYVPPYDLAVNATHGSDDSGYHYNASEDEVTSTTRRMEHFQTTYSVEGVVSPDNKTDVAGAKIDWTTRVLGSYNRFIAEQHKENKFVFPFYVRYAYELYDGSLIMHSYPVLMIPNSRGPIFALDGRYGLFADMNDNNQTYEKVRLYFRGRTYGFASTLMHKIAALTTEEQERLENWKDLIRGIAIYVTPPIYNYNQGGQVLGWHSMHSADPANNNEDPWEKHYTVGKVVDANGTRLTSGETKMDYAFAHWLTNDTFVPWDSTSQHKAPGYCMTVPMKEDKEVLELHESAGQFFKLAEIEYDKLIEMTRNGTTDGKVEIGKRKLMSIASQDQMQDDNGSHDTKSAEVLYGYNRRLNMAGVEKVLHSPIALESQWAHDYNLDNHGKMYQEIVSVANGGRTATLRTTGNNMAVSSPKYLFYPNTYAREIVLVKDGTTLKYRFKLKEHKALNGMFWLGDFMNSADCINDSLLTGSAAAAIDVSGGEENKSVDESNKIYTSETDNPFVIPFGNINIAGGGEVRALCAATQAMSQGQFGQHPMYCFTSEGVWALTVNDTGGWTTIQPVTRDVITAGTKPLSLDSTVVFLTERGLLQLAGSDVKVLSDVLQNADPLTGLNKLTALCDATGNEGLLGIATALAEGKFGEKAWLGYDYDNARIYVTPWDDGKTYGTHGSWVYNLKSGLWTQASTTIDRQVPTYPELETQSDGKVVRISVDRAVQGNLREKGLVISRPIKLADMGLLKRWREIAMRGRFKPYSTAVQVALWGTRDWIDHALVASSTRNRLTRWSGSPYFGHSVGLFLTRPDYAMQVAGMDVEVDAEHDNKLR